MTNTNKKPHISKPMTLEQAIKRFEKGRTSPEDYKNIFFRVNGSTRDVHRRVELEALAKCPVIEYKPYEGATMTFSLETLKMSPSKKCRAVTIVLDPDKALEILGK